MFGSDWPHAEGIADPLGTYRAANPGIEGRAARQLYGGNVAWLAGQSVPVGSAPFSRRGP